MKRTRSGIFGVLEVNLPRLRALGVRRLQLFGSAARDAAREDSDLDFLVELEPKSFDAYMDVKFLLEDIFACDVDLVLADSIKPALRRNILKEAVDAPGF